MLSEHVGTPGFRIPRVKLCGLSLADSRLRRPATQFVRQSSGHPKGPHPEGDASQPLPSRDLALGLIDQVLRTGSSADLQGIPEKRPAFLPFALSSCNPRGSADQYSRGPRTWNVNSMTSSSSAFSFFGEGGGQEVNRVHHKDLPETLPLPRPAQPFSWSSIE